MEKVAYGGWPNCIRVSNGEVELVATTDVGPRIIRFGFVGGENLLKEYPDQLGKSGGDRWRIYGGHRLWHAPEEKPRTYALDNGPVSHAIEDGVLALMQPVEPETGIRKTMWVFMEQDSNAVTITHALKNENPWDVTLAAWALTVMAPGGRLILPQEPYIPHADKLLPARPLVLWHYTDMSDPRWTWGEKYIQLRQDDEVEGAQKAGVRNSLGWAAYALDDTLFLKRFPLFREGEYPDFGCNFETYTGKGMLEVESLGPLTTLPANGGVVRHTERWFLHRMAVGESEQAIDEAVLPLVEKSGAIIAGQVGKNAERVDSEIERARLLRAWGILSESEE
jgi:hypothetical protein